MRASRLRWIALIGTLAISQVIFVLFMSSRRVNDAPRGPDRDKKSLIARSAHGKRVAAEISRVRLMSAEDLEARLNDDWAIFWSGAQDHTSPVPHLDFPRLVACRLRRRFIMETDQLPAETRQSAARRIHDTWFDRQQTHYAAILARFQDKSQPEPPIQEGLRLSVVTGLFACARWSTTADVLNRVTASRTFAAKYVRELEQIPDVPRSVRQVAPSILVPDRSCLLSVLVYAARRDRSLPESTLTKVEKLLNRLENQKTISQQELEWNAWDANPDGFDVNCFAFGSELEIDRRPTDEKLTFIRFNHKNEKKQEEVLIEVMNLLSINTAT